MAAACASSSCTTGPQLPTVEATKAASQLLAGGSGTLDVFDKGKWAKGKPSWICAQGPSMVVHGVSIEPRKSHRIPGRRLKAE